MISAGVDVVSQTTGTLIFSPLLTSFCGFLFGFHTQSIYLLGV